MKKFNQKFLVDIFTDLLESEKSVKEDFLIEKYGKERYELFKKHFLGGIEKYVIMTAQKEGGVALDLTQHGVNYTLELKQNYNTHITSKLNLQATLGAVLLVLSTFFWDKITPEGLFYVIVYWFTLLFLVLLAVYLIVGAVTDFISLRH